MTTLIVGLTIVNIVLFIYYLFQEREVKKLKKEYEDLKKGRD
ncbi:MAG: hypothetical protein Q4E37_01425 [Tissierellia bacterium]|nr:hypothetical protein [Tissierellia bacterium]